ncbi:hypothetical protein GHT06_020660 [Daphnia sinensis]|uniref:Uncharacterized protein n=1 Tax=Daphnia sinensis TaxID=1820382 RepID=A0AAD5PRQ7_9CRUS|nr:hypothetical protein GHT06_020660 [Daphnia sinensis]
MAIGCSSFVPQWGNAHCTMASSMAYAPELRSGILRESAPSNILGFVVFIMTSNGVQRTQLGFSPLTTTWSAWHGAKLIILRLFLHGFTTKELTSSNECGVAKL